MKITLDTDVSDAPGAVCKIVADDGRDILVQQDWDAPGVARTFGWSESFAPNPHGHDGMCFHSHTDGTVDCPECGQKAERFIESAIDFIAENDGREVDDPGYFDGE